jgi:hypothetical protein
MMDCLFQVCENQLLQKELDKTKEDNSAKGFKIKWTQSKLTGEIEAHKVRQLIC